MLKSQCAIGDVRCAAASRLKAINLASSYASLVVDSTLAEAVPERTVSLRAGVGASR